MADRDNHTCTILATFFQLIPLNDFPMQQNYCNTRPLIRPHCRLYPLPLLCSNESKKTGDATNVISSKYMCSVFFRDALVLAGVPSF